MIVLYVVLADIPEELAANGNASDNDDVVEELEVDLDEEDYVDDFEEYNSDVVIIQR